MSLVSSYVRAEDGKLYRNPVIFGDGWFVCFDDDDPVELVVAVGANRPHLPFLKVKKPCHIECGRVFTAVGGKTKMKQAKAYWCHLIMPIPVPGKHEGTVELEKIGQGVIYDPKTT